MSTRLVVTLLINDGLRWQGFAVLCVDFGALYDCLLSGFVHRLSDWSKNLRTRRSIQAAILFEGRLGFKERFVRSSLAYAVNALIFLLAADNVLLDLTTRLVYGIYYTSNVIFAIGFGDLITLRRSELLLVIMMMVFGFMVDVCILANITAAEVDIDENRAKYLQSMECLDYILYKEKVNKSLRRWEPFCT